MVSMVLHGVEAVASLTAAEPAVQLSEQDLGPIGLGVIILGQLHGTFPLLTPPFGRGEGGQTFLLGRLGAQRDLLEDLGQPVLQPTGWPVGPLGLAVLERPER